MTPAPNLPRGLRNCNPGNLRHSGTRWQGLCPNQTDPDFCQFTEMRWGYRALCKTLLTYKRRYGLRTVEAIISRWAPSNENDTKAYVRAVADHLGVEPKEVIDPEERGTLTELAAAISKVENGRPALVGDLSKGVALALAP